MATKSIVHDYINELDHYKTIGEQEGDKQVLHYLSKESEKLIFEVAVYRPNPEGRTNHRVDIRRQNESGEMERILQMRDLQEGSIDISYKDRDTQETKENTRKGDSSGEKTADDFGPHVSEFVEQAFENWGRETNSY
ncbi:MAG: hypothetical protein ABEI86_08355 [Halobacteriaceae archaeon]